MKFINYTTKEGLLSDEVYNLYEDQKGYLWIFTNYGTLKYNSVNFEPVLTNLPFNESFIFCMYENNRGDKWVANSNAKIYRVVNDSAFLVPGIDSTSEFLRKHISEISQLYVDDSTNIYAVTKRYTYKFLNKNGRYIPVNLTSQIKYDSVVFRIHQLNDVLIPTYNLPKTESPYHFETDARLLGLVMDTKRIQNTFFRMTEYSSHGTKHFKLFDTAIYFSLDRKLGKIIKNKPIIYKEFHATIMNFVQDKNGHKWVGCLNNGLYELNEKDSIINHYLDNITVNDILIDKPYGIWASSPGNGLFHCVNINDRYFEKPHPLGSAISLIKKLDDRLWICSSDGSIYYCTDKKIIFVTKNEGQDGCLDIFRSGKTYYFSFRQKFWKVSFDGGQFRLKGEFSDLTNIFKMRGSEDSLFIMHRRGLGVVLHDKLKIRIDVKYKTFGLEYRNNQLFVATDRGIYTYNKPLPSAPAVSGNDLPIVADRLEQPPFLVPTQNISFSQMIPDKYNVLWLCSSGSGLFTLDEGNQLKQYTTADGLPSNIINSISFGDNGDLLLCANTGLYWFNTAKGSFHPSRSKCLYHGNVKNALFFKGNIYITTASGLIVMDHETLLSEENVHFNLRSIMTGTRNLAVDQLTTLPYYDNNLEFNFDIISISTDKIGLIYRLFGPSPDSGEVSGHSLKFQNLHPGSYRLVVFPDVHNSRKTQLVQSFVIMPAFWQTTAFYVALSCFIVVLLAVVVMMIFRSQKRKSERKTQSEKLILEYKLIALKAQINPHFISNCLTAIQHLIIYNKLEAAADYVAKFGFFVRQILNFSTRSLVSLKEELGITMLNLELEQLRFDNKFSYTISIDDAIDPGNIFIPSLILNPIIENAIWHGLLPLRNKRQAELTIKATLNAGVLLLIIQDNGVGRRINIKTYSNTRESRGVKLIEQRLSNINYLYNTSTAKLMYEDLMDPESQPQGTRVTIFLPVNLIPLQNE